LSRIGIITGMRVEQQCLAAALNAIPDQRRPLTYCAGASAERAYEGACALAAEGAVALLSIGIAGGLDAALRPGDVVLPDIIIGAPAGPRTACVEWHAAVMQEMPKAAIGALLAAQQPVRTVAEKAALRAASGALAIDMESGAVAEAADEAELPFLALRIIADPADRAIPQAALHGIAPDGSRRPWAVLRELIMHPADLPPLIRLARDSDAALRQLRRVALLGSALFVPPPG
jgi:adenosylhomocysteine nucleosidase